MAEGEKQAAVTLSQSNAVLVYEKVGKLYKRIYSYGATVWEVVEELVEGAHPDVVDQSGKLWLVWDDDSKIYYANSFDGGHTLTAPAVLINNAITPSADVLPNGFVGLACIV